MPVLGLVAAAALTGVHRMPRALAAGVVVAAVLAGLGGTAAWSVATAATPHTGAIPASGPEGHGSGPGGRGGPGGMRDGRGAGGPANGLPDGGAPGGGPGDILGSPTPSAQVTALLQEDAADYTWVAAAVGSNQAAGYQLASGGPVLALGGFNGTDPYPTLDAFRQMVADGRVHWFVGGSGGGMIASSDTGGSDAATRIAEWVQASFPARTVDGVTLYDLSGAAS
ncbi:putative integral membrane protein [Pseudonocardia sp. Ae168_Ps1]|nr:putative integral membrane protein [Pseudonocardia sp. Ae150A_Ps1]OLL82290.1 putative integral membrane protein [Pseudonocardia sp. Ae168_Ps1]OLL83594.1 putative integral membrane protein [Pseudonocardia sp. Ae263_Ps1]OLL90366.1 putative integral membrane protein [Pseudonocardia sp. Ae356_Ps1]